MGKYNSFVNKKIEGIVFVVLVVFCLGIVLYVGPHRARGWVTYEITGDVLLNEVNEGRISPNAELNRNQLLEMDFSEDVKADLRLIPLKKVIVGEEVINFVTSEQLIMKGYVVLREADSPERYFNEDMLKYALFKKSTPRTYRYEWNTLYDRSPLNYFWLKMKKNND